MFAINLALTMSNFNTLTQPNINISPVHLRNNLNYRPLPSRQTSKTIQLAARERKRISVDEDNLRRHTPRINSWPRCVSSSSRCVVSSRQWLGRFVASNYGARRWAARNVSRVSLRASVDVALRRARKCDAATRRSPSDKLA